MLDIEEIDFEVVSRYLTVCECCDSFRFFPAVLWFYGDVERPHYRSILRVVHLSVFFFSFSISPFCIRPCSAITVYQFIVFNFIILYSLSVYCFD